MGAVIFALGPGMWLSGLISFLYSEWSEGARIILAGTVTSLLGFLLWRVLGRRGRITTRDGFVAVGLAWFAMSLVGMLPYLFTGQTDLSNVFFETASGFSTTGASVFEDLSSLSHGILFWRALTQWIGGMGIIVLSIAVLPLLGVGGVQLFKAESPGPVPDRLTPRFQETAQRLWWLYMAFTGIETLLLWLGDMTFFQALTHSLTTLSTGGFGTEGDSLASFSAYSQWVIILFMLVAGVSFALHYRALAPPQPKQYLQAPELRLYLMIILTATVLIIGGLWNAGEGGLTSLREALFTAVSLVTTTGFVTADFGVWVPALQILVLGLMFVGGMAGSTAGSVKTFRVGILGKAAHADLRRIVHPRGVFVLRFGRETVRDPVVTSVQSFFLFYMLLFVTGTFLVAFIDANSTGSLDFVTSMSSVAASLGNIGPGLGEVGPTVTYAGVPAVAKWLLSILMIVGRLEIFPVLVLFTRDLWRR